MDNTPQLQCPQCGRDLPETTPGADGSWAVWDGDGLIEGSRLDKADAVGKAVLGRLVDTYSP